MRGHHERCLHQNAIFLRYGGHKFEECRNGWTRKITDNASVFLVASDYQCGSNEAVKELLFKKFPSLSKYSVDVYDLSDSNDWIYVKFDGLGQHSLYCPVSALANKDSEAIVSTHLGYWHNYGRGKYDEREKAFIESDAVQNFLNNII